MLRVARFILFPFSVLYGVGVRLRNLAYDKGILFSKGFNFPVIVVGNLAVGGAGKSPMTEYLVDLLKEQFKVATLSRGYGRKSKGFRLVQTDDSVKLSGDEPLQFKRKFKDVTVAVCENRVEGVERLKQTHEVIVLDDAYQHRALRPGLSILLFDFNSLLSPLLLLPAGRLRDEFKQRHRADILVITKVPEQASKEDKAQVVKRLKVKADKPVFFSSLCYQPLYKLGTENQTFSLSLKDIERVVLLSGIANPGPLEQYWQSEGKVVHLISYPDHYQFTLQDLKKLKQTYEQLPPKGTFIVTTEKDAQRLRVPEFRELLEEMPIWVLPVKACFPEEEDKEFKKLVLSYVNHFPTTILKNNHA